MIPKLKRFTATGAVLAAVGLLASCGSSSTASNGTSANSGSATTAQSSGQTIKVGFIDDFSGALGIYGNVDYEGVQLAVDQFNAKGGLNGTKIELVRADAKTDQATAVQDMRNMIYNQNIHYVINGLDSAECGALAPLAAQTKTVLVSWCGADSYILKDGTPWSFRIANMGSQTQSFSAAAYAAQHFPNKKKWYLIANDYSFGRQAVALFKQRLQQLEPDVQFVGESYVPLTATDYTPYITAIIQKHPDALFDAWANGIPFWKQAASYQLSKSIQIVGGYWGGTDELVSLTQAQVPVGAVVGGIPWYAINSPENTAFVQAFQHQFTKPPESASYWGYITGEGLVNAMSQAKSSDPTKVRDALSHLSMKTPIGQLTMDSWDNQGVAPYYLGVVSWDSAANQGRVSDATPVDTSSFMPTQSEVTQARK